MADRRTRRWLAGVAMVAAAGVVAGCADAPVSDQPRKMTAGGSQVQAYAQPLPPPGPGRGWSPTQVVLGFLHASASYAFDPAAARQYLAPALSKSWDPRPLTVVSSLGMATQLRYHPQLPQSGAPRQYESVQFTGQRLATLSQTGQYQYSPGTSTYEFILTLISGVWRISTLPAGQSLVLTQPDFEDVYQPRNLFFFGPQNGSPVNGELVPDPVYAPLQSANSALNTDLASGLVEGLLTDRGSWLSGATTTSFPPRTKLLGITISGQTAIVNLGGGAARAPSVTREQMQEQLQATLGSKAYSPPLARSVELEINGRPQYNGVAANLVYQLENGPYVYQAALGTIDDSRRQDGLVSAAELGSGLITAVTASWPGSGKPAVAVAAQDHGGCTVYLPASAAAPASSGGTATTQQYRSYRLASSGGPCTSLNWDGHGYLWAVAGQHIWALKLATGKVASVAGPPNLPIGGQSGTSVLALEMAPDSVRAALLIKAPGGNRLALAAVTSGSGSVSLGPAVAVGTELTDPIAVSWYSPYDLVALTEAGIWEVPLTGGPAQLLGGAPAGASSLTTDGTTLVVGTSSGEILTSSNHGDSWSRAAFGSMPSYSS